ncbi:MAG: hypothetical protein AAB433_17695, partial [Nitrospirota bacterium]
MNTPTSLRALFSLPGFVAASRLVGVFGDRAARVLVFRRRKKLPAAHSVDTGAAGATTNGPAGPRSLGWRVHCPRCRRVFVERGLRKFGQCDKWSPGFT